jgi:hypothetical protein
VERIGGKTMEHPWYVITGNINLDNFTKLWAVDRGFIWKGYTYDYQMIPSAAEYNRYNERVKKCRTENCHPLAEIKRVAEKIYGLNKLQKFPFEIPLLVRKVLFFGFYQPEDKFFKDMDIKEFPDSSLAQAMSIVQHEFGGTSLLDFSISKYKALYFALGREENFSNNSYIFGLNVPWFETQQGNLPENIFSKYGEIFDLLYPSYFMNDKIAHQEGVFLYQKFNISDSALNDGGLKYKNIIDYFKDCYNEDEKNKHGNLFEKILIDDFLTLAEKDGNKPIFYVSLDVPAKEKRVLKEYLNTIGITDNFMMNTIVSKNKNEDIFCNSDHKQECP